MKKQFFICFMFSLFISFPVFSQKDSSMPRPKNLIYGEFSGNAFYYSANYARVIWNDPFVHPCLRLGACIMNEYKGPAYLFPFEASLLVGKKRHFFEPGFGVTAFSLILLQEGSPGGAPFVDYRKNGAYIVLRFGYCFMPYKNGLMFRVAFTPLFFSQKLQDEYYPRYIIEKMGHSGGFIPDFGASVGYAF